MCFYEGVSGAQFQGWNHHNPDIIKTESLAAFPYETVFQCLKNVLSGNNRIFYPFAFHEFQKRFFSIGQEIFP